MAPFYRGYDPHFTLDQDDVSAIQVTSERLKLSITSYIRNFGCSVSRVANTKSFQALYGTKTKSPRGSRPPPPAEEDPELCKDPKIDAMFNTKDGEIIAFKGTYTSEL